MSHSYSASVVNYRLTGETHPSMVSFEGPVISVQDLKQAIIRQRNMMNEKTKMAFDLRIIDEETGREYLFEKEFVPKGAHVMIKRIAVRGKAGRIKQRALTQPQGDNDGSSLSNPLPSSVVAQEYICRKCGEPGHNVKLCPNVGIALPTKSYAFINRQQTNFVNPNRVQHDSKPQQQHQPQQPQNQPQNDQIQNLPIPPNCTCPLCHTWLNRTVTLSCCSVNLCQGCFDQRISQGPFNCPQCNSPADQTSASPNPRHDKMVADVRLDYTKANEAHIQQQQLKQQQQQQQLGPQRPQNDQYGPPQPNQNNSGGQNQGGQQQGGQGGQNRYADVTCRNCGEVGHWPSHCRLSLRDGVWLSEQHAERRRGWIQQQGLNIVDYDGSTPVPPGMGGGQGGGGQGGGQRNQNNQNNRQFNNNNHEGGQFQHQGGQGGRPQHNQHGRPQNQHQNFGASDHRDRDRNYGPPQ